MKIMKRITAVQAPQLRKSRWYPVVVALAGLVAAVTTLLLFMVDKIIDSINEYGVGGAGTLAVLVTAAAGVFALPYLLRLTVSPLMRLMSCGALVVTVCGWLLGAWWIEVNTNLWYAEIAIIGAYISLVASFFAIYVIGLPVESLKKKR